MTATAAALAFGLLASAEPPPAPPAPPAPEQAMPEAPPQTIHDMSWEAEPGARTAPARVPPPPPGEDSPAAWAAFCAQADGAAVLTGNGDYLGRIADGHEPDSVFNPQGTYGHPLSASSIWNATGRFGGALGPLSPFNPTGTPPLLVADRTTIAVLTGDPTFPGGADPARIALMCYGTDAFLDRAPDRGR